MPPDPSATRPHRSRATARPGFEALEGRELRAVQIVGNPFIGDRAGSITLTLVHHLDARGSRDIEQMAVDTVGGTAVPGVDYAPVHQVVTFRPGDRRKTITVPIFPDDQNTDTRTFALVLDHAPFPANSPTSQTVVVSIVHQVTTQAPPRIKEAHLLTSGDQVTGFVIAFDKDMALGPVQDVNNYFVHRQQGDQSAIPLLSAVYTSSRRAVTLIPAQAVPVGRYIVENPGPVVHSRLTDVPGNALDGVGNGLPNGVFFTNFAPRGPVLGPVYKARLATDQRIHALRQKQRGERLGESLGLGGLPFLL